MFKVDKRYIGLPDVIDIMFIIVERVGNIFNQSTVTIILELGQTINLCTYRIRV